MEGRTTVDGIIYRLCSFLGIDAADIFSCDSSISSGRLIQDAIAFYQRFSGSRETPPLKSTTLNDQNRADFNEQFVCKLLQAIHLEVEAQSFDGGLYFQALLNLAISLRAVSPVSCLDLLAESVRAGEAHDNKQFIAIGHYESGACLSDNGEYDKALTCFDRTVAVAAKNLAECRDIILNLSDSLLITYRKKYFAGFEAVRCLSCGTTTRYDLIPSLHCSKCQKLLFTQCASCRATGQHPENDHLLACITCRATGIVPTPLVELVEELAEASIQRPEHGAPSPEARTRTVRVFVSSTFVDMHAERDYLAKVVFPKLKEKCRHRNLEFIDIDLRWGVTREQNSLDICLDEIDRCRPFFVGILGERYGTIPTSLAPGDLAAYPWLAECEGHSYTALEFLHGALRPGKSSGSTFFYFRDPSFLDKVLPDRLDDFVDAAHADEAHRLKRQIQEANLPTYTYRCDWDEEHLSAEDGSTGRVVDLEAFGDKVHDDLWQSIQARYPMDILDGDERLLERAKHHHYANTLSRLFVGRGDELETLFRLSADSQGGTVLLIGEPGRGKSSLLAAWATMYRQENPDHLLVDYYIGASQRSTSYAGILRQLCLEVGHNVHGSKLIPTNKEELGEFLTILLNEVGERFDSVVLIVDGLDRLGDEDLSKWIGWCSSGVPKHVRVVESAAPREPFTTTVQRSALVMDLEDLPPASVQSIATEYLSTYGKSLGKEDLRLLIDNPSTGNPLFLMSALAELRLFGGHKPEEEDADPLRMRIVALPNTLDELFDQVLSRLETDVYTGGVAVTALRLLACSRSGLTEGELIQGIEMMEAKAIPRVLWSRLNRQIEPFLFTCDGVTTVSQPSFLQAIRARHLEDEGLRMSLHSTLSDLFANSDIRRQVAEYPWQLIQAMRWDEAIKLLTDATFFDLAWSRSEADIFEYWQRIEQETSHRLVDCLEEVLVSSDEQDKSHLFFYALLLREMGHPEQARSLLRTLEGQARESGNQPLLDSCLLNIGAITLERGEPDEAIKICAEAEKAAKEQGNMAGVLSARGNAASVLHAQGKLDEALEMCRQAEQPWIALNDRNALQVCYNNQAMILKDQGKPDEALELLRKQERICRDLRNWMDLQRCLAAQVAILRKLCQYTEAFKVLKEQRYISEKFGIKRGLISNYSLHGGILRSLGRPDEALALLDQQEALCHETDDIGSLQSCLGEKAVLLFDMGKFDEALALFKEKERICSEMKLLDGLMHCRIGQAAVYQAKGLLDQAMALLKKVEHKARETGHTKFLQQSLGNQAGVLLSMDLTKGDEALELMKEQEQICVDAGESKDLMICLANQADLHFMNARLDEAQEILKDLEERARDIGHQPELSLCLTLQCRVLAQQDRFDEALKPLEEAEQISERLGNRLQLSKCHGVRAYILIHLGDFEGALRYFKSEEAICREFGNLESTCACMVNQARLVTVQMNNPEEGLAIVLQTFELSRSLTPASRQRIESFLNAILTGN